MGDEQRGEVQRSHMKRAKSDESRKVSLRESQNQGERVIEDVCRKTGKRWRKPGALFSFFLSISCSLILRGIMGVRVLH